MATWSLVLFLLGADFPICTAANSSTYPAIHYTGSQFYVFWIDTRQLPNFSIYGSRVSKTGTVIDPAGVEIYTDSAGYECNVSFDGTNFLVLTRNYC